MNAFKINNTCLKTINIYRITHRRFSYANTLKFKLYGPKPLVLVIHPYKKKKPIEDLIWEAEEAIGLARASKWDPVPGSTLPEGYWDSRTIDHILNKHSHYQKIKTNLFNQTHIERSDEDSDDEYDLDDKVWNCPSARSKLAESCLVHTRTIQPTFYFTEGKLEEISYSFSQIPTRYIFINTFLSSKQHLNLEKYFNNCLANLKLNPQTKTITNYYHNEDLKYQDELNCETSPTHLSPHLHQVEVIDRFRMILEIFSLRANSTEAKLQIDLARLSFIKNKLAWNSNSYKNQLLGLSQGHFKQIRHSENQVNLQFHDSHEQFTQYQKRLVDGILLRIKEDLAKLNSTIKLQRQGRQSEVLIAVVGYTNSGKTALMNQLCDSKLKVRNILFQTLGTSFKHLSLNNGISAIMVDSIGFIQNLPSSIVSAFQSVLEEIKNADILLHVRDTSHKQFFQQFDIVRSTLIEIGITEETLHSHTLEIWNKVDLLSENQLLNLIPMMPLNSIPTSAINGLGCDLLKMHLAKMITSLKKQVPLKFEFTSIDAPSRFKFLNKNSIILNETITNSEDGRNILITALTNEKSLKRYFKEFGNESIVTKENT